MLLSPANSMESITAGTISFKFAVLFVCRVVEIFPLASKIDLDAGFIFNTSFPSGDPVRPNPRV